MPQPAVVTGLGASTLARKWKIDVDVSALQDGTDWRRLRGATDVNVNPGTAGLQPDTDYDADGFTSQTATTQEWGATATLRRAPDRLTPTVYDPAQEFIRARGRGLGPLNTAHIRAYEWNGVGGANVEAYEGYVAVTWANGGGDPGALATVSVTLTGQGACLPITHPDTTSQVPAVSAVTPFNGTTLAAAGGGLLVITGAGFSTVTVVTIGGNVVPATTDWEMLSDNKIVAKAPAHAAGAVNVTVTNPAGTSPTGAANSITYV